MGAPVDRSMVPTLAGMLVLLGLALLEWLGGQVLGSAWSVQGVLAGLALGAVLLLLALATRRARGELAAASVAALSAVGELALGAVIVFALAAAAAALLPLPLSASFMQGDRATDFIVFGACALALLLHTLVENAIKHGIEPKTGPVTLCVSARRDPQAPDMVLLEVRDSGVGLQPAPPTRGSGLGLRSVRERLALHYGERARLSVAGVPGGGVVARIVLPLALPVAP